MNKQNKIILGQITKIRKTYFEIITNENEKGIVYISDVSDYYVQNLSEIVKLDNILYLVVKKYENGKLICSFKENRSDYLRSPFEYSIGNEEENFQNLFDFVNREVLKWRKLK